MLRKGWLLKMCRACWWPALHRFRSCRRCVSVVGGLYKREDASSAEQILKMFTPTRQGASTAACCDALLPAVLGRHRRVRADHLFRYCAYSVTDEWMVQRLRRSRLIDVLMARGADECYVFALADWYCIKPRASCSDATDCSSMIALFTNKSRCHADTRPGCVFGAC